MSRLAVFLLATSLVILACMPQDKSERNYQEPTANADNRLVPAGVPKLMSVFPGRIGEGAGPDEDPVRSPLAPVQPLSDRQIRLLLERLPTLEEDVDEQTEFALRPGSLPPPRTGVDVRAVFPPADERLAPMPEPVDGPARVLRHGPEGPVPLAAQVSLTFDRPMVAVTAHDDLAGQEVPVELSPTVPGSWRWVGTRTLLFEPESARLPMATQYTVRVSSAMRGADGARQALPLEWTFSTPPLEIISSYPSGSGVSLEPVIVVAFNQRVELATLVSSLAIVAADGRNLAFRQASDDEIEADEKAARMVEQLEPGRWVALKPEQALPAATDIELVLAAGAASAEGPLLTTQTQRHGFSSHGRFQVTEKRCGWNEQCAPYDPFRFSFSNRPDPQQNVESLISVSPKIDDMEVHVSGSSIQIGGLKTGQTRYHIEFDANLKDHFGQPLSGSRSFSFETGSLPPGLNLGAEPLTTLDPSSLPAVEFFSTNYRSAEVRVWRVEPADWPDYIERYHNRHAWRDTVPELPGVEVFSATVEIDPRRDEVVRTRIDLTPWLDNDRGHVVVMIEPGKRLEGVAESRDSRRQIGWFQATAIGIDAASDARGMLVWTTRLADGVPLEGAEVRMGTIDAIWSSDAEGLVSINLPEAADLPDQANWLEVRVGQDVALLPESPGWARDSGWHARPATDDIAWHVFDDRKMYRPGEIVHLKGWLRELEQRPDGGLGLPDSAALNVDYTVADARGNTLHEGSTGIGRLGGFELKFELPETPNLGPASVQLTLSGMEHKKSSHHHGFRIEEFRTPEFEVETRAGAGPFVGSDPIEVEVLASYYAGGALPGADVRWDVSALAGHFAPPGHDEWHFGFQPPVWLPRPLDESAGSATLTHAGQTDGAGRHALEINLDFTDQPRPLRIVAAATVTDFNRQAWNSRSDVLAHPGQVYVGLRSETQFVDRNEPLVIDLLTVDLGGAPAAGRPVVVEAVRVRQMWPHPGSEPEGDAETQRCELTTAADGLAQCQFETSRSGRYQITATSMDERGRHNASRIMRWVGGGSMPRAQGVEIESLVLIPDREQHAPGDIARLLVESPFERAEGLLTLRRHGLAEQRRFAIDNGTATLEIPLRHDWMPNIQAHITLVGSAPRDDDQNNGSSGSRPAIAVGSHKFSISTAERSLSINLQPSSDGAAPGEEVAVALTVVDAEGRPVADAEVALVMVDEAILALSGYRIGDPLELFYQERPPQVHDHHLRPTIQLLQSPGPDSAAPKIAAEVALDQSLMHTGQRSRSFPPPLADSAAEPIEVREDFNPLAAFIPTLVTDDQGRVQTRIRLPDNLTRYRITALAVSGADQFGRAEAALTARLPLMLRPSPPRFLNFGDTFEFPLVLQNQTDRPLPVHVAIDMANLESIGARGYALEVPANDRVEVRFPAAARSAGTARYQIAVTSDDFADAARGALPVWTPATMEAFATYGALDEGVMVQPVAQPTAVWPQFGQLEVTTTSTALHSLTDAFIYLHNYPHVGSEQIASRLIATAALKDILFAFEAANMPTADEIAESMERDLTRLAALQNPDGGFGLWFRGSESWPYATLHVAHALVRIRRMGYPVADALFDQTLAWVGDIEQHIPDHHSDWISRHLIAYSLYVRALADDPDRTRARELIDEVDELSELSFESVGWLLSVLTGDADSQTELQQLRRFLGNRVVETASGAGFVSEWRDGAHLIMHSERRADGIILEALIDDQPESDLIERLVSGLQAHRTRGRWSNTQENAFVLLALNRYFQRFEDIEPDFVARTWLGDDFAGEHRFVGRTTERHHIEVPMTWLVRQDDDEHRLVLQHDGAGRMYYRVGMAYAPRSLELTPARHGFEVQRSYSAVDDPDDVRQRSDGVWEIRAGARVRVELTMIATARRYHVALVDPLPAGLEAINPALAVSDPVVDNGGGNGGIEPLMRRPPGWWWGPWYQHQNLRDERAEAFTTLLPGGVYEYVYHARATTLGEFVVPPARAEELYHPETFGRSASMRVVVFEPGPDGGVERPES